MNRGFAAATGQLCKYRVWQVGLVTTGTTTLVFLSLWYGNPLHLPLFVTTAVYFAVSIPWMVWSAAALRCPVCGARPVWYRWTHVTTRDASELGREQAGRCGACGFTPERRTEPVAANPRPGWGSRVRFYGGCLLFLIVVEGISLLSFPEWWPSSGIGWVVYLILAPAALGLVVILFELAGTGFDRASLWISKDDFSFPRILFGILVLGAYVAGLVWLRGL